MFVMEFRKELAFTGEPLRDRCSVGRSDTPARCPAGRRCGNGGEQARLSAAGSSRTGAVFSSCCSVEVRELRPAVAELSELMHATKEKAEAAQQGRK
jgi:hypothetical protein